MASTEAIRVFAPAKINLFLHVGATRPDGYHAIKSLVTFADVGDDLAIEAAGRLSLSVEGPFAEGLQGESDNIVLQAARRLAERGGISAGARITLTKNLPVASGMGGGSSDAAAALRGLTRLWQPNVAEPDLQAIAASLGADVPVCLKGTSCWVEGIGETLTVSPMFPVLYAVLVTPGVRVSTAMAYGATTPQDLWLPQHTTRFMDMNTLIGFLEAARNDLEEPVSKLAPAVREAIGALREHDAILLARMSGSGATCFGLCGSRQAAQKIGVEIAAKHPNWWIRAVRLGSS